jgi:uncharacterized protein (TIGR02284 family)
MTMNNKQVVSTLNRLHRLCIAGERGFEVVAQNVSNRGLKLFVKSFAQQRADFADELRDEIQRLDGECSERKSIRGIVHRGRINIRSALTIGPQNMEKVALGEALHGENAAVKAYQSARAKDLPPETLAIVDRQGKQVEAVREQVSLLKGREGTRMVVRLFDTEEDCQIARQSLQEAGYPQEDIEMVDVQQLDIYEGQGSSVNEAVVSGAIGGGLWGILIGAAAGVGVLFVPGMGSMIADSAVATLVGIAIAGTLAGILFGAILGFVIGHGVFEEDAYLYDDSLAHGTTLLQLLTSDDRALEAARIMHQINAAARARPIPPAAKETQESEGIPVNGTI